MEAKSEHTGAVNLTQMRSTHEYNLGEIIFKQFFPSFLLHAGSFSKRNVVAAKTFRRKNRKEVLKLDSTAWMQYYAYTYCHKLKLLQERGT